MSELLASADSPGSFATLPWHWLVPLLSSLLYVAGIMSFKYATRYRISPWHSSLAINLAVWLAVLPLWSQARTAPDWSLWWQPCLAAGCYWFGQFTTLLSLERGEVSIATPVLGLKILFVALLSTFLTEQVVSERLWFAAILSVAAIALLQFRSGDRHHHVMTTILWSAISALSYALFDVLVVRWSPGWSKERFLPLTFSCVAICSLFVSPLLAGRPRIPRAARRAVFSGAVLIGLQGALLISTIAWTGDATRVNLIYNARGLWGVLAVWLIGHWYDNAEQHLDRAILWRRLIGAAIMLTAIVLAVWE